MIRICASLQKCHHNNIMDLRKMVSISFAIRRVVDHILFRPFSCVILIDVRSLVDLHNIKIQLLPEATQRLEDHLPSLHLSLPDFILYPPLPHIL
jgi:hypothetical protein